MDLLETIFHYKSIIVYGAGKVGRVVIKKILCTNPNAFISAAAVTKEEDNPKTIMGISVVAIEKMVMQAEESVVLIATRERFQKSIEEHLYELGFCNICYMRDELYCEWENDNYIQSYVNPYIRSITKICNRRNVRCEKEEEYIGEALKLLGDSNTVNIPRLVIVLGTKCSLRCRECNNLIPYFKPQEDLDINVILHSLECILSKVQTVLECELIGGEPFLSSNLNEVINFLIKKDNVYQIEITTNGTIVPDGSLLQGLQNPKTVVRVSDYGTLINKEKVVCFLKENSIAYEILECRNWRTPGGIERRGRGIELLKKYYGRCDARYHCKTLYNGKIFECARAASLYALGYMSEPEFLEADRCKASDIKNFILKDFSYACDYCDMTCDNRKFIAPAEQL